MTLTTMMRMAREGSLATVLAVALIAVPSLAIAGPAVPHSGTTVPLPAVHGVDPGNHGPHGGGSSTPVPLPNGTNNGNNGTNGTTTSPNTAGGSIGMEVMGGAMIGLGILMLLLKDNTKAQSIVQSILQAIGMGSILNGSTSNGGIISMLTSLFGSLNGGSNPLAGNGGTNPLGSLGSVIGAAGSIANGGSGSGVGLNTQRASVTSGAVAVIMHSSGGIGLNRGLTGNKR